MSGSFTQNISGFFLLLKPKIVMASGFSAYVGMVMAKKAPPDFFEAILLIVIIISSAAASVLMNNLLDQEIDAKMQRTKRRLETIENLGRSTLWLFSFLTVVFASFMAFILFNTMVTVLLICAILSYVIWYTLFLKRKSPFGAILGGLPGALPVLIGGFASSIDLPLDVWLFFGFMMLWQPAHFWALALKIEDEYRAAEIPVLPVSFGVHYTKLFIGIYGASLLPVSMILAYQPGYSMMTKVASFLVGMYYILETVYFVFFKPNYSRAFYASLVYVMILMSVFCFDLLT